MADLLALNLPYIIPTQPLPCAIIQSPDNPACFVKPFILLLLILGCRLCMGHAVDQNLLSLVQQDVKELITNYKQTEAEQSSIQESLAQQRTEQSEMQNTMTSIQDQQSSTRVQLQEHNELLNSLLEWKEQQVEEKQEIMEKLMSLEKTLSDELLFRVEGLEKGLAKAENEVEQLDRDIAKTTRDQLYWRG